MKYDLIIVDCFNYIFRHYRKDLSTEQMSNLIIDNFLKIYESCSDLTLVFDPIIVSDYRGLSIRKQIDSEYKKDRVYPKNFAKICQYVYSYFCIDFEKNINTVTSKKFEADDFIDNIIKLNKDKRIALITNDEDWFRVLDTNVVVITSFDLDKPFTKDDFIYKYNFIPTEASLALFKAILGDTSDNIKRVVSCRQPKLVNTFFSFIQEVGKEKTTVSELIDFFQTVADGKYEFKEEDTVLDAKPTVALSLITCKTDDKVNTIINNLYLAKSNFNSNDDYHKYIKKESKDTDKVKMLLITLQRGNRSKFTQKFKKLKPLIVGD